MGVAEAGVAIGSSEISTSCYQAKLASHKVIKKHGEYFYYFTLYVSNKSSHELVFEMNDIVMSGRSDGIDGPYPAKPYAVLNTAYVVRGNTEGRLELYFVSRSNDKVFILENINMRVKGEKKEGGGFEIVDHEPNYIYLDSSAQ